MNCLHYGGYSTKAKKNKEGATTYRKNRKAQRNGCFVKNHKTDKYDIFTIRSICSEHNHAKYNEKELLNLVKFQDFPNNMKDFALSYFLKGQNISAIISMMKIHFEKE